MTTTIITLPSVQNAVKKGQIDFKSWGDVYTRVSPCGNFLLFNYVPSCQYKRPEEWNNLERMARGLIIDRNTGETAARPLDKFWNWLQYDTCYSTGDVTAIFEKVDGSLIIPYTDYNKKTRLATRGSFGSWQADRANELWQQHFDDVSIPADWTILMEYVAPSNRIVINYGDFEGFVILGARNRHTGEYIPMNTVVEQWYTDELAGRRNIRLVKQYDNNSLQSIIDQCNDEQDSIEYEGYVVYFDDDSLYKIKNARYLKVHKLISNVTEKSVYEAIATQTLSNWTQSIPDEFINEIQDLADTIDKNVNAFASIVYADYKRLVAELPHGYTRRDFALSAKNRPWSDYMFKLENGMTHIGLLNRIFDDYLKLKKQGIIDSMVHRSNNAS